jgi:hypothetical protein
LPHLSRRAQWIPAKQFLAGDSVCIAVAFVEDTCLFGRAALLPQHRKIQIDALPVSVTGITTFEFATRSGQFQIAGYQ